jgi:NADH-quinone oxidoreductase subunit A
MNSPVERTKLTETRGWSQPVFSSFLPNYLSSGAMRLISYTRPPTIMDKAARKGGGNMQSAPLETVWPLLLYFALVVILVAATLAISYVLGERHNQKATGEPYESGIVPTGSAEIRFPVKYYLVGMFFVIFDLEAVFVYAWAVSFRGSGWVGFGEMAFFIGILLAGLAYLWRIGALDWGSIGRRSMMIREEESQHAAEDH